MFYFYEQNFIMDVNTKLQSIYDLTDKVEMGNSVLIYNNFNFVPIFHEPYCLHHVVITHCTRGTIKGTRDTMPMEIKAPCLIQLLPNNILQSCEASEDVRLETIVMSVEYAQSLQTVDYFEPFILLRENPVVALTKEESEMVQSFFRLLQTLLESKKGYGGLPETVRSLFDGFLHVVKSFDAMGVKRKTVSYNEELFHRFWQLVIKEHARSRQIKYYAGKLFMTPKYMARIIKSVSGRTAADWINRYVILEAKYYLHYRSDLTIESISGLLGFSNPSFFGKFFKAQVGETPGKYRKRV